MPAYPIKQRLTPYKILSYILYAIPEHSDWIDKVSDTEVRLYTGVFSRKLRMKIASLWEALYWLETQGLILEVTKEKKRGTVILKLKQPNNILIEKEG